MAIDTPLIDDTTPAPIAERETVPDRLFHYSAWVHVGPGAETCEAISEDPKAPKNECSDPLHFHAWVRLPNQFQHSKVREKALAARGRRTRQLRDPSTDAYEALEATIEELATQGDLAKPVLVDELLNKDRFKHMTEAIREVNAIEEGVDDDDEPLRPYEHIADDQERLDELTAMDMDDRPTDEFDELTRHVQRYDDLVQERFQAIEKPLRDALMEKDVNSLLDLVRNERIRIDSTGFFMTTYSRWEWFVCSYVKPDGPKRFDAIEQIDEVAPEVYHALKDTFDDLEQSQNMGVVSGNS